MNKKFLLKWGGIAGVIILVGLALGFVSYMYTEVVAFDKVIAKNVYINDVPVGELTKEEAKEKLETLISEHMTKQFVVLKEGSKEVKIPLNDFGMTYNYDEVIHKAFEVGHNVGFFRKYHIRKNGISEPQSFYLDKKVDENKINEQLQAHKDTFYTKPINATLRRENGTFITTKEVNGSELHLAATRQKIANILKELPESELITVEVETKPVQAEYTEKSFDNSKTLIASFSTSYNNANENRNENLKVAAQKINRLLLPDEIFYLSNQLEPFTEAAGYKNAATIVNGKIEDSLGGGICQVSSTLYNALLLTELEIVSRQNHSLAVSYVPLGRDATYNTDTIDFKFRNNSKYPIYIESYCQNNQVIVNIYGHPSIKSDYTIKFESVVTEIIPAPETKYKQDSTLYTGKEVIEVYALDGKRVNLYKLYYEGDKLINKVLVNKSYYRPRAAVIRTGTKPLPTSTDTTSNSSEVS